MWHVGCFKLHLAGTVSLAISSDMLFQEDLLFHADSPPIPSVSRTNSLVYAYHLSRAHKVPQSLGKVLFDLEVDLLRVSVAKAERRNLACQEWHSTDPFPLASTSHQKTRNQWCHHSRCAIQPKRNPDISRCLLLPHISRLLQYRGIVTFNFSPRNLTQVTSTIKPGQDSMFGFSFGKENNSSRRVILKIELELNNLNSILSRSAVTPVFPWS